MMHELNYGVSNLQVQIGDDYVDTLINKLQAAALPNYDYGNKMVNPPMVAIRFGNEIFIKGVVTGVLGRYICHFITGVIFFGMYAPEGTNSVIYSLTYNATYIIQHHINLFLLN